MDITKWYLILGVLWVKVCTNVSNDTYCLNLESKNGSTRDNVNYSCIITINSRINNAI